MPHILLVEDDERLARMTSEYLEKSGLSVKIAPTVQDTLQQVHNQPVDAIVLDLTLPDGDGLDVCRQLRAQPTTKNIPILMLTARGDPTDRIIGLELGADDYLPKPFEPRELVARIRAVLRRQRQTPEDNMINRFGRLEIDQGARTVRVEGEEKPLTSYQFDLLSLLSQHPGRVLSREFLMDEVKGETLDAFDRSIDVHMSRIRSAIEDDPKHPRRIVTVRGVGYVFAKAQD